MKLAKVLLRWYKSFNINYNTGGGDRRAEVDSRPWDTWAITTTEGQMIVDYPFVEIPVEPDITTVVGANESGKSHLLSAISKVVTGNGIPGDPYDPKSAGQPYGQTDLCHFSPEVSKNFDAWPHIGLEFSDVSREKSIAILKAAGQSITVPIAAEKYTLVVILAPHDHFIGFVYFGADKYEITSDQLVAVRAELPKVHFINSQEAIADELRLADILAAYGVDKFKDLPCVDSKAVLDALGMLKSLPGVTAQNAATVQEQISQVKAKLQAAPKAGSKAQLELKLFKDVLEITAEALTALYELENADRGYIEACISQWNRDIEKKLNLSRYWQQDQNFTLSVDYKERVLYFEITDKTESKYTFRERSSGLRYFLSYYIQARALEGALSKGDNIVLMDEPDSFLSVLGQRNLLAIFDSIVNDGPPKNAQLIYTTHSPFLIDRNFPRRIRLIRKGEAEEGSQFVPDTQVRRFEPVRSALGIDLAQTLFMSAVNLILEGPTDQFLITETIRAYAGAEGMGELLDLNSVVVVSAESVTGVERLLNTTCWGDEPNPVTVIMLDSDAAGTEMKALITGNANSHQKGDKRKKKLIPSEFVKLVGELCSKFEDNHAVITTEDIIPANLYKRAIDNYVKRWYPSIGKEKHKALEQCIAKADFAANGVVDSTREAFNAYILDPSHVSDGPREYDKMGVLLEVVRIIQSDVNDADCRRLANNVLDISRKLGELIDEAEQAETSRSSKQRITRLIKAFFKRHKSEAHAHEVQSLFAKIKVEVEALDEQADSIKKMVSGFYSEISQLRNSKGIDRIKGTEWQKWSAILAAVEKNPLNPDLSRTTAAAGTATTPFTSANELPDDSTASTGNQVPVPCATPIETVLQEPSGTNAQASVEELGGTTAKPELDATSDGVGPALQVEA